MDARCARWSCIKCPGVSFRQSGHPSLVSLTGNLKDQKKVQILRDTGASQSFILSDVVTLSGDSFCGSGQRDGVCACLLAPCTFKMGFGQWKFEWKS